ncbi:MAG TPA: secretin N-terminal domain-containing protein [Verrucomicrobiae bacterium]|nr:secretin N-terminal domain-containing protein [Verrucomicrobiae bacterium]
MGNNTNLAANPIPASNPLSALLGTNAAAGQPANSPATVPAGFPQPAAAAAAAAVVAPAKPAEPIYPAGELNFPDMPIEQVMDVYAMLVDRTVLRAPLPPARITLKSQTPLTRSEAIQALKSVLAMNNITMINVGEKFVKAVPVNLASTMGSPFNNHDAGLLAEDDEYITHIVQLKYVKPKDIIPVLAPLANIQNSILPIDDNQMLIIRDYSANVKRMLELIKQVDVMVPLDFDYEVIPIKYAQVTDIASALSSLGGGTGTSIGKSGTVGSGTSSPRMGGMGMSGGMGQNGMGTMGNSGMGMNQQGGQYGGNPGGSRTSSFADRLKNLVTKAGGAQGDFQVIGNSKIIADQRTNSLLVFASKQDMEMIKKIIDKLDIVLAQVLIEAIIMEVSLGNTHNLGVSYLQNTPLTAGHGYFSGIGGLNNGTLLNSGSFANVGTNLSSAIPSGFSYWANFGNDFQATLTAIATDSRINVLSRPTIQTSHGVQANIQVGDQIPMVTGTYFGGINGAASSQYQLQFVGIQLQVTPLINTEGLVVMDINEQVQDVGPSYTIDNNQVPSTTQRSAQATVSVRDRDTIILGGMISSSKNTSHSGVPILKDIPVLGYLFRNTSVDKQRKELIVLIHPTVLPTPEAAALVATHERNRMPLIKRAEAEEQSDANRRLRDSQKVIVPDERQ